MVSGTDASEALWQQSQAIEAMSRLLNALLDVSKLESGAIRPEPTDFTVATLFEELRREFATLATSKGLQLHVDSCADCVHSDPSLVQQILRNLVANAIKYTREGWVQLRCLHEAARVRIEVLDTGIGIPADQIPYIYDEFYQVNGANRSREGYGLGLSIVQRLVKLLALELDVRSELGRGSTFSLVLPAGSASTGSVGMPSERTAAGKIPVARARVLLVEDDPAVLGATRMLLAVAGYQVIAVTSMKGALEAAREAPTVDLVIADYHLGDGETGVQVIGALREAFGAPVKAVLMTGDTSSLIKELPADSQLRIASKPINADELLNLLATFMGSSHILTGETNAP